MTIMCLGVYFKTVYLNLLRSSANAFPQVYTISLVSFQLPNDAGDSSVGHFLSSSVAQPATCPHHQGERTLPNSLADLHFSGAPCPTPKLYSSLSVIHWAPCLFLFLWFLCWHFPIELLVELLNKSRSVKKRAPPKFGYEGLLLSICFSKGNSNPPAQPKTILQLVSGHTTTNLSRLKALSQSSYDQSQQPFCNVCSPWQC